MEKAELEHCFGGQDGLEKSGLAKRFSELSTDINLVKNPGPTIACHNVGHMCIH